MKTLRQRVVEMRNMWVKAQIFQPDDVAEEFRPFLKAIAKERADVLARLNSMLAETEGEQQVVHHHWYAPPSTLGQGDA